MRLERTYWKQGYVRIAGVDEAGMGPLAGPVVAGAVVFAPGTRIRGARDSKTLTARSRTELDEEIRRRALCCAIGVADLDDIQMWNIYHAGLLAMRRALEALDPCPDFVLVDARRVPGLPWPQEARIKGDAQIHCVACASILAKVHRDRLMVEYDHLYPDYGFAEHKGYATRAHREAIARLGPSPIHRRGFRGLGDQLELFDTMDQPSRLPAAPV